MPSDKVAKNLPKTVTRFYSNSNYAVETLEESSIAFVHNKLMNDPFDPYFFLETEFENRADFLRWVECHHPDKYRWIKKNINYEAFSGGFRRVKTDFDKRRRNTYLFSTSAEDQVMHPKDNLYLWGHYGWGHRGIAIEFNAGNLARSVLAHGDPDESLNLTPSDLWVEVDYRTQVAPLSNQAYLDFVLSEPSADDPNQENPGLKGMVSFLDQTFKTKHEVWSMEHEWRLLWNNDSGDNIYRCPISEDAVAGIYLGLRVDGNVKERLFSYIKTRRTPVLVAQAVKADRNFALRWKQTV